MSTTDPNKRDSFILKNKKTISAITKLLTQTVISGNEDNTSLLSLNCVLMISSAATSSQFEPQLCNAIMNETHFILYLINDIITNKGREEHFGILVNLTRYSETVSSLYKLCPKDFLLKLLKFIENNELISGLITNFSQLEDVRETIVSDKQIISKLFDVFEKSNNLNIKNACICIIRNCCFDTQLHQKLLIPQNELLIRLVMPIAGPEEFDDEVMNKLPIDLQYLGHEKTRETDPEIRKLLIESLLLLCSTRFGREVVREMNIYYILREYHKWEKVREVQKAIEDVVDILIKKESEINEDNLKLIEIPDDLIEKFNNMDKELLKEETE
jgi:hypothetical protein